MRRDACHNRSFEESPSFARLQPIAKPHATRSFGLVERSGPDRKAGVFLCHFFLKSRFYMPQLCSVALNVFRLPCEKIRGFWPRNRILARNPPASEEKDILLQQKPRSAKSMPVKMWQIVPECGLVAIFGPILATEPRSGTEFVMRRGAYWENPRSRKSAKRAQPDFEPIPCQNAVPCPFRARNPARGSNGQHGSRLRGVPGSASSHDERCHQARRRKDAESGQAPSGGGMQRDEGLGGFKR